MVEQSISYLSTDAQSKLGENLSLVLEDII